MALIRAPLLPVCCVESFATLREQITLSDIGAVHQCVTCGRRYELRISWALLPALHVATKET